MRALGGFAVLAFFGLLGAVFVVGLAGWRGSDPRPATGYYLASFAAILLLASLLGLVGSAATLARPDADDRDVPAIEMPAERGRAPAPGTVRGPDGNSDAEPQTYPPQRRVAGRGVHTWESRYSAGVGLLTSLLMGIAALWGMNVASNLTDRNLFTGKARPSPGPEGSGGGTAGGETSGGGAASLGFPGSGESGNAGAQEPALRD